MDPVTAAYARWGIILWGIGGVAVFIGHAGSERTASPVA